MAPGSSHRRAVLAGLAALGFARPSVGQDAEPDPLLSLYERLPLFTNLTTRIGAAVVLNGRKRRTFVIDTGAERSVLAQDVADALELDDGPEVTVHGVTSAARTPTARLDRLAIGGRTFRDLHLPIIPRAALAADGLLGLDVLSHFRLELELADRRMALTPSDGSGFRGYEGFATPTRLNRPDAGRARKGRFGQLILTDGLVDDTPVRAFIDTGAQYSIGNSQLETALGRSSRDTATTVRLHGVTGQSLVVRPGSPRAVRLARQTLEGAPLLFGDLHAFDILDLNAGPALLLGADILYRFRRVTLDYGRGRLALALR